MNTKECWINPNPKHPEDWFSLHERAGWVRFVPAERQSDAIVVEAVAEVIETEDGADLSWLIEGGICALPAGVVLMVSETPITGDDGSGEVYAEPRTQLPMTAEQFAALLDSFEPHEKVMAYLPNPGAFLRAVEKHYKIGVKK